MRQRTQQNLTGLFQPSQTVHRDVVPHLPRAEQVAPGAGLGAFKPLIRMTGLNVALVNALRSSSSSLSKVLDGQLRSARERSFSTRLGLLCYEAIVHNKERDRWNLGYSAYRIPKMMTSRGLFHPLPLDVVHPEHKAWRQEQAPIEAHGPVTATFAWMMAASERNERASHWVRVLRLFEQQARGEARAHLLRTLPDEVLPVYPVVGRRYRPSPEDWSGFRPLGAELGRITPEILACLHLEAQRDTDERGKDVVLWHGAWNQRIKGAVLGAVLVRRLNRMWSRLHGPHMLQHHGTAVGGRPTLRVLTERAVDDPTVRTSYLRLGMRFGALTLRDIKGMEGVTVWLRKPRVLAALAHDEGLDSPSARTSLASLCTRYLARAEHSKMLLDAQRDDLWGTPTPSLAPKVDLDHRKKKEFFEGFNLWEIFDDTNDRTLFNEQGERLFSDLWRMKEELTRQHHAYVLELSEPS